MGAMVNQAVAMLNARMGGAGVDGTVKLVLTGEGSVMLDAAGAREGDDPADVTLTAEPETFRSILDGDTSATAAFMSGKLSVDGDMGLAMRLASVLG